LKVKEVEVEHHRRIGAVGAGMYRPLVQHDGEVAIDRGFSGLPGMDDEHPHHADRHLKHLVGVRVVHKGAVLAKRVLVGVGLSLLDMRLDKPADAVHAVGDMIASSRTMLINGHKAPVRTGPPHPGFRCKCNKLEEELQFTLRKNTAAGRAGCF